MDYKQTILCILYQKKILCSSKVVAIYFELEVNKIQNTKHCHNYMKKKEIRILRHFCAERKIGEPSEKNLTGRTTRTNNKLNPHDAESKN